MEASFPPDRWPAKQITEPGGAVCFVLKDGTEIHRLPPPEPLYDYNFGEFVGLLEGYPPTFRATTDGNGRRNCEQPAWSTRHSIVELSLPYDAGRASGMRLRIVKFDQRKARWLDAGPQTVNFSKHVITARVSAVGKFTVVAEARPTKH
jgi:hypothetical protein